MRIRVLGCYGDAGPETRTTGFLINDRYLLDGVCNKVGELRDGSLEVFSGTYTEMKGARRTKPVAVPTNVYKVVSSFTNWTTKKKYRAGDRVTISDEELGSFRFAMDSGKLRQIRSGETRIVKR